MRRELSRLFFIMEFSGVGGLESGPVKPPTKPVISTDLITHHLIVILKRCPETPPPHVSHPETIPTLRDRGSGPL